MKERSARNETKSLPITKGMVYDAYLKVKSKRGSAGIDGMSLAQLDTDLSNQLYKLWNRMSSGSYHPPAVKRVNIAKPGGGIRPLGIPTVLDRIGQMVVRDYMEARLDAIFHPSSFGYRPRRNAHQALQQCRTNCRAYHWVVDLDIKGFFDHLDHDLLLKAVNKHFDEKWVNMYVKRWLKAAVVDEQGKSHQSDKGTPQGGVISPLLANLYLHYCFDVWFTKLHQLPFERYADDIVIHCHSYEQAQLVLQQIKERMAACQLTVHPDKSGIVYCGPVAKCPPKRKLRRKFTFLGYDFKPCFAYQAKLKKGFTFFSAAIGKKATKRILSTLASLIGRNPNGDLAHWAKIINPKMRGWIQYYSLFYKWELRSIMRQLNHRLTRWVMKYYKRFKESYTLASAWLRKQYHKNPKLFVHWQWGIRP